MTNLKKVGLTALAGTLATMTAVQAADVSISGKALMEYETNSTKAAGLLQIQLNFLIKTHQSLLVLLVKWTMV